MLGVIRLSDKTTHGGIVLEGSSGVIFMGLPVSCMLDKVFCPIHGKTIIIEGDVDPELMVGLLLSMGIVVDAAVH